MPEHPANPDLVRSVAELARIAGISRQTIYKWRKEYDDCPAPELVDGRRREDVRRWHHWCRRGGFTGAAAQLGGYLADQRQTEESGTESAAKGPAGGGETGSPEKGWDSKRGVSPELMVKVNREGVTDENMAKLISEGMTPNDAVAMRDRLQRIFDAERKKQIESRRLIDRDVVVLFIETACRGWVVGLDDLWQQLQPAFDGLDGERLKRIRKHWQSSQREYQERITRDLAETLRQQFHVKHNQEAQR